MINLPNDILCNIYTIYINNRNIEHYENNYNKYIKRKLIMDLNSFNIEYQNHLIIHKSQRDYSIVEWYKEFFELNNMKSKYILKNNKINKLYIKQKKEIKRLKKLNINDKDKNGYFYHLGKIMKVYK